MPKDYAKYQTKKSTIRDRKKPSKTWGIWVIALFLIIAVIAGMLYLNKTRKIESSSVKTVITEKRASDKGKKVAPKKTVVDAAKVNSVDSEPQFDFYTILPKDRVAVSQQPSVDSNTVKYLLQVATVKNSSDAEHIKSELALIGFEANVEQLKINDVIWYRVNVGPYSSEIAAKNDQKKLNDNKVQSVVVKK